MLGFAFTDPNFAIINQRYRLYVGKVVRDGSVAEMEALAKFFKSNTAEARRKVLWIVGTETLRQIRQSYTDSKLGNTIMAIFDTGEKLQREPNIRIVDAELEIKTEADRALHTWKLHRFDLECVMASDPGGFGTAQASNKTETKVPLDGTAQLSPVRPAKSTEPPNSLSILMDPILDVIVSEKNKSKAKALVAARLVGTLSKSEWLKALERMERYGVSTELLRAALRAYRDAGHTHNLRGAVRAVVLDAIDLPTAAKTNDARTKDLRWINQYWPLDQASPDMFA